MAGPMQSSSAPSRSECVLTLQSGPVASRPPGAPRYHGGMTLLTVWDETNEAVPAIQTQDFDAIVEILTPLGVRFSRWEVKPLPEQATSDEVLATYAAEIDAVKDEHHYTLVDAMIMTPSDDAAYKELAATARQKFLSEHAHDDDEDRFFARGSGVFYLRVNGRVHAVLCEEGDLISVPANTTHWFDMGTRPDYVSVRFFHDDDGWVGNFTGDTIATRFATYDQLAAARV